jgi:hypothetical protein
MQSKQEPLLKLVIDYPTDFDDTRQPGHQQDGKMPHKNPSTERFGGPGSSRQDRKHPDKFEKQHDGPEPGAPTSGRSSKVSGGGGERDKHHSHDSRYKS